MTRPMLVAVAALIALVAAAPVTAAAPDRQTSYASFSLVDDELCPFPVGVTVERTRTTTTFANGDVKRHTELIVNSSANGKTIASRTTFNVLIDADTPTVWVITGLFEIGQLRGDGTIWLQSGRLVYDVGADELLDPHPGPLGEPPDVCAALAA